MPTTCIALGLKVCPGCKDKDMSRGKPNECWIEAFRKHIANASDIALKVMILDCARLNLWAEQSYYQQAAIRHYRPDKAHLIERILLLI